MAKHVDVPKDMPVLIPTGKRPSLKELAEAAKVDDTFLKRIAGIDKLPVAAFNSSI